MAGVPHQNNDRHTLYESQLQDQQQHIAEHWERNGPGADMLVDCRCLHVPRHLRLVQSYHSGYHLEMTEHFAGAAHAPRWLPAMILQVHAWGRYLLTVHQNAAPITALLYSKSGKHRRVLAALMLQLALRTLGWNAVLDMQAAHGHNCSCEKVSQATQLVPKGGRQ